MIVYNNYTCMYITYYQIKNDQRNKCQYAHLKYCNIKIAMKTYQNGK